MKIYVLKNKNVFKNTALQESILLYKAIKDDILLISQCSQSISVGRNQNIYRFLNHDYIEKKGITITRRLSGGGAIYEDVGTVSFSFITHNVNELMSEIINPIINFLKVIGLNAKCRNKINIYVENKKISLINRYHYEEKILYHGRLLFNSNLKELIKCLTNEKHISVTRLTDHANNDVVNIKSLLNSNWTTKTFIIRLINYFHNIGVKSYEPTRKILDYANKIWLKTSSWQWIYGPYPIFNVNNIQKYNDKTLEVKYNHIDGKINKISIFGDFKSRKDTLKIEEALKNVSLKRSSISRALSPFKTIEYFGQISKKNVIDTILSVNSESKT